MTERRPIRVGHVFEAIGAMMVWGFFRLLPVDAASALGGMLFRLIGPRLKVSRVAERNLRRAFPDKSASEIAVLLRGMWDNLGRNVGEFPHLERIAAPGSERLNMAGTEHLEALRDDGRPGLCFSAHLANWQLQPYAVAAAGLRIHVFFRAPNNPLVMTFYRHVHKGGGGELLTKGRVGARQAVELLKGGEHIGMLVDQKMNDGIAVPFFGRDAMTAPALAQLAQRFAAPVVPVRIIRQRGCRFQVRVEPPLALPSTGDRKADVVETMRRVNGRIEAWIREHPEQWLWVHRRWPD